MANKTRRAESWGRSCLSDVCSCSGDLVGGQPTGPDDRCDRLFDFGTHQRAVVEQLKVTCALLRIGYTSLSK